LRAKQLPTLDASTNNPTAQVPAPTPDESYERYTIRAHKALMSSVPDPDERNALVWGTWDKVRGQRPEEAVALSKFSADRFERSAGHCNFTEHETVDRDGNPRKYGLRELATIVREHSKHERNGYFPAVTAHHTPDDPGGKQPDVLGYSGLQRLGMFDRDNPKWAIFSDEFHIPDAKAELARKPYRSVELLRFRDGRMRFHPVAAVGAESPRLLMPTKYTQGKFDELNVEGAVIERYTVAAAFPGGSNTFVKKPVKYSTEGDSQMPEVTEIMAALQETPQFKFLTRLMEEFEAEQAAAANGGMPAADPNAPPAAPAPAPGAPPPAAPAAPAAPGDDLADLQDLLGPEEPSNPTAPPPADKPPEKNTVAHNPNVVSLQKYNALHESHQKLIAQTAKQHGRLEALERSATDANRRSKLTELAGKFPGIVDVDEEAKLCLYSLGAQMSDEQFNAHVGTVEKYAQRFADSPMIPRGEMPERYIAQTDAEKYEERLSRESIKIHGEIVRKENRQPSYDECESEAKKRLGAK